MFRSGWWNWHYSFLEHSEEAFYTTPLALREGHKEYTKWMNMFYREGAIAKLCDSEAWGEKKQQNASGYTGVVN